MGSSAVEIDLNRRYARHTLLLGNAVFFQNLNGAVENRGVLKMNDAATRSGFVVKFYNLAVLIIVCAKIIAHGLFVDLQVAGDTGNTARW